MMQRAHLAASSGILSLLVLVHFLIHLLKMLLNHPEFPACPACTGEGAGAKGFGDVHGADFLWKSLIPFALGSTEIQLEIVMSECRCVFPLNHLPEGWEPLGKRRKGGISDAEMGFGSTMQPPENCVCFSQNSFPFSVISQSLLKGKLRSLNAQKLKLAEAKVKSCSLQGTLGADSPAQTRVAAESARESPFLEQQCSNCIKEQEISLTN